MPFTDLFINRPKLAWVINLAILLIGVACLWKISLRLWPKIQTNVITVSVSYPGASPSLMESFVTSPLEQSLGSVNGLDYMSSSSSESSSQITMHFKLGYNINTAIADVTSATSSARYLLPKDIRDPIIKKMDPNSRPIMYVSFTSKKLPIRDLTYYLKTIVTPRLQTINGVQDARVYGARDYAMRVWLNPVSMLEHRVTPLDVSQAIQTQNIQSPTGSIETINNLLPTKLLANISSENEFKKIIVKSDNNNLVTLGDIANVQIGSEDYNNSVFSDGSPSNTIAISAQPGANPLYISKNVEKKLQALKNTLPTGVSFNTSWDTTKFIKSSLMEVGLTIIIAIVCVIVVMFLFLGSWRPLLVPLVTIPLSLLGVCAPMLWLSYSLNTLTLLALVLAIGMVVDDAIVVSENIYRHIEKGEPQPKAAILGAREIVFAVIAMTVTLAAVFAPIAFTTGLVGALFKEFAFTLSAAVIISGIIALTLSPVMCSRLLTKQSLNTWLAKKINHFFDKLKLAYEKTCKKLVNYKFYVCIITLFLYAGVFFLYYTTPSELAPSEDMGGMMIIANGPTNSNISYTERFTRQVQNIISDNKAVKSYVMINGFMGDNSAGSFIMLKNWGDRPNINKVIGQMFYPLSQVIGLRAFPINPFNLPGASGFKPVNFVVTTLEPYSKLNSVINQLKIFALQNPKLKNVDSNLKYNQNMWDIKIDRALAARLGIDPRTVGQAINLFLSNGQINYFQYKSRSYEVIPQLLPKYRSNPDSLQWLGLRTKTNNIVSLQNLIKITNNVSPQSLNHFQELRSATLSASLAPGYTQDEALKFLRNKLSAIAPKNFNYGYTGQSRQFIQSGGALIFATIFAFIFIYLVLTAQFESFMDPVIILLMVPLSIGGGLILLKLVGGTINIYTKVGLLTLVGLISKHGILMVEFANQCRLKGLDITESIVRAAGIRLRPILMTSFAMIIGAIPLAFAVGAGAQSRMQIGVVIIGGMLIGTAFTLFILPSVYLMLSFTKPVASLDDKTNT